MFKPNEKKVGYVVCAKSSDIQAGCHSEKIFTKIRPCDLTNTDISN